MKRAFFALFLLFTLMSPSLFAKEIQDKSGEPDYQAKKGILQILEAQSGNRLSEEEKFNDNDRPDDILLGLGFAFVNKRPGFGFFFDMYYNAGNSSLWGIKSVIAGSKDDAKEEKDLLVSFNLNFMIFTGEKRNSFFLEFGLGYGLHDYNLDENSDEDDPGKQNGPSVNIGFGYAAGFNQNYSAWIFGVNLMAIAPEAAAINTYIALMF